MNVSRLPNTTHEIEGHKNAGAPGHTMVVSFSAEEVPTDLYTDHDCIVRAEQLALSHCSVETQYPKKGLIAQAMRAKPDPTGKRRRFSVWVRPRARNVGSPWGKGETAQ